jgi:hypothetical protein
MTTQTAAAAVSATTRPKEALVRRTLVGNALFSELTGLALLLLSAPIARFLGVAPSWPLLAIGAGLLLFGVQVYQSSRPRPLDRRGVWTIIGLDVGWVAASALLLIAGWLPLTQGGAWTVLLVADAVATFAVLQYLGLRRATP